MPDPIQSPSNLSWYPSAEGASAAENAAQICSVSLHDADLPASQSSTPAGPRPASTASAGATPGASVPATGSQLLVARFTPAKVQPAPQPSVLKSALACAPELANVVLTTAAAIAAAPETLGASLLAASRITLTGAVFDRCATRDEEQQVKKEINATAAKDCEAAGGTALLASSGSVVCAIGK